MRIGFIEDTRLHGGTQIWVTEAVRYFLGKGEKVTVLTPQGGWVSDECAKTAARMVTYDYDDVVAQGNMHKDRWADALGDCDVAVCTVHPPRDSFHCAVFAAECVKAYGLKTVLVFKTGTIVPEYRREFYLPDEAIHSRVIAIADFTRQYLLATYKLPPEMVELIYQGTDTNLFSPGESRKIQAVKQYPLPQHASPILGNVGSFEQRKGQVVLLEALSQLVAGPLPDAHLILVGDGPDKELLAQTARALELTQHVTFFPFAKEPVYVYELLDILVLPSLYKEGLPNVLLEALSMGVPVVASNIAGVPEVVKNGETGFLVEAGHSGQLAAAITKMWLDQKTYIHMKRHGRRLMEKKFDKQRQFDRFLSYFYTIARE